MQFDPIMVENPGIVFFGSPPKDAVVVVTGVSRSQTTRLALLLGGIQGLPLYWTEPGNSEDYEFFDPIEAGDLEVPKGIVADRPERWVVKRPYVWRHTEALTEILGPRLTWVFIFRDPMAVAAKCFVRHGGTMEYWLAQVVQDTHEAMDFALAAPRPKAIISAEKLILHQAELNHRLRGWLT
jgi:hypothetical protein